MAYRSSKALPCEVIVILQDGFSKASDESYERVQPVADGSWPPRRFSKNSFIKNSLVLRLSALAHFLRREAAALKMFFGVF